MTTEIEGTISICAHRVSYSFGVPDDIENTKELRETLEQEAESRSKEMINQGCHSGELNCLWKGETEIRGWWNIE